MSYLDRFRVTGRRAVVTGGGRGIGLACAEAGADDLESLGRLRKDFELGLGVVDVTPGIRQSPELIVKRVERALERVEAARITLNPDCGFAPGSAAKVDIDEVYRKLCAEVEAARLLRARR
jgi:5-methyltetrahydropteroyltriglutamate--homocysteine methyltransferase